eukprot:s4888_g3.t5
MPQGARLGGAVAARATAPGQLACQRCLVQCDHQRLRDGRELASGTGTPRADAGKEAVEADVVTFGSLVSSAGRAAQWQQTLDWLRAAQVPGHDATLILSAVMSTTAQASQWRQTMALLEEVGADPDVAAVEAALDSLELSQQPKSAPQLLHCAARAGIKAIPKKKRLLSSSRVSDGTMKDAILLRRTAATSEHDGRFWVWDGPAHWLPARRREMPRRGRGDWQKALQLLSALGHQALQQIPGTIEH